MVMWCVEYIVDVELKTAIILVKLKTNYYLAFRTAFAVQSFFAGGCFWEVKCSYIYIALFHQIGSHDNIIN
jgi:hypothetical protein